MIQMKKMQYVVASLLAASVFTTAAEAANFNNEVKTQQGVVAGAYDDKHQVVQWLGVPYAQQPTGADRWREAQQAKKHKGNFGLHQGCTGEYPIQRQKGAWAGGHADVGYCAPGYAGKESAGTGLYSRRQ